MRIRIVRTRTGFTLVELMVAMALTIFIMLILTQAFVIAIDTFTTLKAIGDTQEILRSGANAVRNDLGLDHLEGKRRLSDPSIVIQRPSVGFLSTYTPSITTTGVTTSGSTLVTNVISTTAGLQVGMAVTGPAIPPNTWVFAINNAKAFSLSSPALLSQNPTQLTIFPLTIAEGSDLDNMMSWRSNYALHMTCRLRSDQQQSYYTTQIQNPGVQHPFNPTIQFFNLRTLYGMDPTNLAWTSLQTFGADADATLRPNYANRPPFLNPSLIPAPSNNNPILQTFPNPNPPPPFYPAYFYRGQWAEVFYFLGSPALGPYQPTGTTEEPTNPEGAGLPLYGLYRAYYVMAPDTSVINNPDPTKPLPLSAFPGYVNPPNWVLNPSYAGMACTPLGPAPPPSASAQSSPPLVFHSPANVAGGALWTLTGVGIPPTQGPTGGTFTITYNGQTTIPIPSGANSGFILGALQNLANVGVGNVQVSGGPVNQFPVLLQFSGPSVSPPTVLTVDTTKLVAGLIRQAPWRTIHPSTPPLPLRNATLVVPNVLSFHVRSVLGGTAPVDLVFDSAYSPTSLLGLSITLRVWDNKTRQARQLTIVQDL